MTSCLHEGFYSGWKDYCLNNAKDCVQEFILGDSPEMAFKAHQEYLKLGYHTTFTLPTALLIPDGIKRGYWTFDKTSPVEDIDINKHTLTLNYENIMRSEILTLTAKDHNRLIISGNGDNIIQLTR